MNTQRIVIGFQNQAKLPIYLNKNGNIECGIFTYKPTKLKKDFKSIFQLILDRTAHLKWKKEIDVSQFKVWNAMSIYEEYILKDWNDHILAETLERLAIETEIHVTLEVIRSQFKKAISRRFKKERKMYKFTDSRFPKQGWQVFINRESTK